jgi:murein DD-endopeptidase MepM/ murein hydrolase activator NlpD
VPLASARLTKPHPHSQADAAPVPHVYAAAPRAPVDHMSTASLEPPEQSAALSDSAPEFRWPARGRITEGYRRGVNDGINIALPEGTSVKAAEAGIVVYAGNEVRGYGNLVLIRHSNGFVTAYANNGELDVRRGETVRRGQVIAKSGETGNATSPQLHFEVRKGTTPVDPTQYLAGL